MAMEYESLESTAQVRQFLESCFEEVEEDTTRRHGASVSVGSRLKMSDTGSLSKALQRANAGDRTLRVGVGKEKKVRRQIANSNERKRMQSINDGFQSLKALLPPTDCGEKLSKATILQHAANYIAALLDERKRLLAINTQCMLLIGRQTNNVSASALAPPSPSGSAHKRRKSVTESSDEGISLAANDYKHSRSRGRDVQSSEVTLGVTDRVGNKRLKRVLEEVSEAASTGPLSSVPESVTTTSTRRQGDTEISTANSTVEKRSQASCLNKSETSESFVFPPAGGDDVSVEQQDSSELQYVCSMTSDKCSVSRRNLETIVMAIRHLEGGNFIPDVDNMELKCELMKAEAEEVAASQPDSTLDVSKEIRTEIDEAGAIKRRWQTKWEKGMQRSGESSSRPEGVMKLKDRLLRKRQMELEQKGQQDQEPSTPQHQIQDITLFAESRRLLQHPISNTNDDICKVSSDSLVQRLQMAKQLGSESKYKNICVTRDSAGPPTLVNSIIADDNNHNKSSLPTIAEHSLGTSHCFPFYYSDRSSLHKPVMLNVDITDHKNLNSVSRCPS